MLDGPGTEVSEDREAPRTVHPVDAADAVTADVRTHERDQHVHRRSDKCDVHGSAEGDHLRGEPTGERRGVAVRGIDARDPADRSFGDIQRAIGSDGCPHRAFEPIRKHRDCHRRWWSLRTCFSCRTAAIDAVITLTTTARSVMTRVLLMPLLL